jgi:hypothetical protein
MRLRWRNVVLICLVFAALSGCSPAGEEAAGPEADAAPSASGVAADAATTAAEAFAAAFAAPIEAAHGKEAWERAQAVSAGLSVAMGGNQVLAGRLLFTPQVGRSRIELADGTLAVFDGEGAWVSPAAAALPQARFHLLTWPYFLAAPFKLRDPGAHLEDLGTRPHDGVEHPVARLTFDPGVGDSPDDWYVVYRDPATDRLAAMAYVVTYGGRSAEEAGAEPHAITYHDFRQVDGVTLPTTWRLWNWSEEEGVHGDPIGEVTLAGLAFVTPPPDTFARPADAEEDPLPAAE